MFEFLLKDNRKVTDIKKQINRIDIQKAKLQNIEFDAVIITNGGCEYSKQFNGVKIPLETSLKDFPFDYKRMQKRRRLYLLHRV